MGRLFRILLSLYPKSFRSIHCIANHSFEGARFHAAEEDRARARLLMLQTSSCRSAMEGEM
jgi:hypothetical protein